MSLVDASGTGIEVQGAVTLLSNSCAATVLLNDCPFGDAGIEEIATELAPRMYLQWDGVERPILGTRHIRTLGLANTGMGDGGAAALAEALRHPECTVETVDVGGNAIGIPGTRGQVPRRPKSAGFLLQGGTRFGLDGKMPAAQTRKPSGVKWAVKPPQRPRPAREFDNGPTPLAQALNENGLGHFARKLCDE